MSARDQLQEHHGLNVRGIEVVVIFSQVEEDEALHHGKKSENTGDQKDAGHVPFDGACGGAGIVVSDGHDGKIVQQGEGDNHDCAEREEIEEEDRGNHKEHDRDRHRDAIEHVAHHAFENPAGFLDAVDDDREARGGENKGGGGAGGIGCARDGDADIGLFEGGGIIDSIARHADDVPGGLEGLDDAVFMFREDACEAVGRRDFFSGARGEAAIGRVGGEEIRGELDIGAHAEFARDRAGDGHVVTGDHFDFDAQFAGIGDGLFRVCAGRVEEGKDAQKSPVRDFACGIGGAIGACGREGSHAACGEIRHLLFDRSAFGSAEGAEIQNDGRHSLRRVEDFAIGGLESGFGAFADRVERDEGRLFEGVQSFGIRQTRHDGEIDGIFIFRLGCEGARKNDIFNGGLAIGEDIAEGEFVLGEGARFVRAENIDAREFLDGFQARDDGFFRGEDFCAQSHCDRENRRGGEGHGGNEEDEDIFREGKESVLRVFALHCGEAVQNEDNREGDGKDDEEISDADDSLLEVGFGTRRGNEFGGPSEEGIGACRRDDECHFSLFDNRAREDRVAAFFRDGEGFARESRLVHAQVISIEEGAIGGDHIAEAHADNISRNQIGGGDIAPLGIAKSFGREGQRFFESREGI